MHKSNVKKVAAWLAAIQADERGAVVAQLSHHFGVFFHKHRS
jgi:hypothetical protein